MTGPPRPPRLIPRPAESPPASPPAQRSALCVQQPRTAGSRRRPGTRRHGKGGAARRGRAGRAVRAARTAGAARQSRAGLSRAGLARRGPAASGGHFSLILAGCGGKGPRERPRGSCGRRGWGRGWGRGLGRAGGRAAQRSLRHRPAVREPGGALRGGGRGRRVPHSSRGAAAAWCRGPRGGRERPCGSAGAGAGCRSRGRGRGQRDSLGPANKAGEGPAAPPGTKPAAPCEPRTCLPSPAACAGSARLGRCNCWTESKGAADELSSLARSQWGLLNYFHFALSSPFTLPVFCFLAGSGSCFERLASLMGSCTVVIGIFI